MTKFTVELDITIKSVFGEQPLELDADMATNALARRLATSMTRYETIKILSVQKSEVLKFQQDFDAWANALE